MEPIDMLEIIGELNDELFGKSPELYENGLCYAYISTGWVDVITFCEHCIYSSELNSIDEIESAGGFKNYLIQQRDRFIDMLVKVKGK